MKAQHILIVDDDPGLRELLTEYFEKEGFSVGSAADGKAMHAHLESHTADLIVLDLMLPGDDGLTLARQLRSQSDVPIIILSARGEDVDRIVGLEIGADDYVSKPFNPRELLARIRAVLRRRAGETASEGAKLLSFGPYQLDINAQTVYSEGRPIPLTSGDFALLKIFVDRPNRVLNRDQLLEQLKGYERMPNDRSVDVRVTRLRKKLEPDPASPCYIRTVWGEGYLFTPQGIPEHA